MKLSMNSMTVHELVLRHHVKANVETMTTNYKINHIVHIYKICPYF